ncbi:MAG: hypothetical protein LBU23_12260 [Planctomycetota bacterium]|nr:hypothetical protein [Planctomycetota bacterium]
MAALLSLLAAYPALGAEGDGWRPLLIARFGDVDAIDAEEGHLASFLRGIRNDGRYAPPLRSLIGPEIRNPTFFGLLDGAWLEAVLFVPPNPGGLGLVWVFPAENRDEYMNQLAGQGLSWFDGMDGITILREMDANGAFRDWCMEWLPGEVAFFSKSRAALAAAVRIYAKNGAVRGLLAEVPGAPSPDLALRLDPARLSAWQDREPGSYWWRENIELLTRDLLNRWRPGSARIKLIRDLANEFAAWPLSLERLDLRLWLEEGGVEGRLDAVGAFSPRGALSELESLRHLPDRSALAYAVAVGREKLREAGDSFRRLLLGAAGGAVGAEARETAFSLFSLLQRAGPRQAAAAWVPPPSGSPDLGAARLLVIEWDDPDALTSAWSTVIQAAQPNSPAARALAQMGLALSLAPCPGMSDAFEARLSPVDDASLPAYADLLFVFRRSGSWTALASGAGRIDLMTRRAVTGYLAGLAGTAAAESGPGGADIRETFTRMGRRGADILAFSDPVRFLQMAMIDAADWRPRPPDQTEPPSIRMAREMSEYRSGGVWSLAGETGGGTWTFNGGMPWPSLSHLAGALGVTESIGME